MFHKFDVNNTQKYFEDQFKEAKKDYNNNNPIEDGKEQLSKLIKKNEVIGFYAGDSLFAGV
jgi:hypothetical protein